MRMSLINRVLGLSLLLLLLFACGEKKGQVDGPTKSDIRSDVKKLEEIRKIEIKKNLDLSSTTVNYFKPGDVKVSGVALQEDDRPFEIVDYGPVDELPSGVFKPTIYVVFSQPVVPLAKLGDPMTESPIMQIEPAVKGVFRWYGTKLLSFEPAADYMPQQNYKVTLGNVKSLGGKELEGQSSFSFRTEYLYIRSMSPSGGDIPLDVAANIRLHFSYPVDINHIKQFITVTSRGKDYSFKAERPEKTDYMSDDYYNSSILLKVQGKLPENSNVLVTLKAGASSEKGFMGTPQPIVESFNTINPFKYSYYNTYSYTFPKSEKGDSNPVYLTFSHPIDEKSVKGNISTSLNVADIDDKVEVWGHSIKISNLPVTYESVYEVLVSGGIKDIYGRSLGTGEKIKVEVPAAARYSYFPNRGTKILEAQFPPRIIYEYQNIFEGRWNVKSIDDPYKGLPQQYKAYDFSGTKKNMRKLDILDLSPWLNESKKGYVGMIWNFEQRRIPESLTYHEFESVLIPKAKAAGLEDSFRKWYYTNNNKEKYRLNYDYYYNGGRHKIADAFKTIDYELPLPDYGEKRLQLQVTDLAITTRYGYNKVIAWVTSMSTGKPVEGADVSLLSGHSTYKTIKSDRQGLAIFELNEGEYNRTFYYHEDDRYMRIRAVKGDDMVEFKPNSTHNEYHFGVSNKEGIRYIESTKGETFIFTDRGLYKPGETVTFRGIDRNLRLGDYTAYEGPYSITVNQQYQSGSTPLHHEQGQTSASGGFYSSFTLPEDLNPGYYEINYERGGMDTTVTFQVANFRRLNFQVTGSKPDITIFKGDKASITVAAEYLAGGTMGGAPYSYYWNRHYAYYRPPGNNWNGYKFGPDDYDGTMNLSNGDGQLDPTGAVTISQETDESGKAGATYRYELSATVEDIDRQMVARNDSVLVHPASFYIGARFAGASDGWWSPFVSKGDSVDVNFSLVRPDGSGYEGKEKVEVELELYRIEWKIAQQQGVYGRVNSRYQRVETLESKEKTSVKSDGSLSIKPENCGRYFVRLKAKDSNGREAITRFYFYSTGSEWFSWGVDDAADINLIADKSIYEPGETVQLMVQSPLPKGDYLVTIEREGIMDQQIVSLEGSANVLPIEIKEEYLPVVYVGISSYSVRTQDPPDNYFEPDMGKPKAYFGMTEIRVSTALKEIELQIIPAKKSFLPGSEAEVEIIATRNGKPLAGAEITFLAADRGVLDLINYHVPDPVKFFYDSYKFPLGVSGADSRSLLIDPVTYEVKDLQGGDGGKKMQERKDFRPTAVFEPYLLTDSSGKVKVKFKLPDTLTTYRCTAVAVNSNHFGIEENEIKVQNPVNVRTALPRKLRVRDTSFAGVVVTNLDSEEHEVTVSLESDLLTIEGEKSQTVKLPSNSVVEVPFKIVALTPGEAKLTFTTTSGILNERLIKTLEVERPLVKEAFATIGQVGDDGWAEEGLIIPSMIAPGYGGVSFKLDSTRLTTLAESFDYLYHYPYGCLEQRSSRLFPLIVFGEKILPFVNIKDHKKLVEKEMAFWAKFQNSDGGFSYWPKGLNPSSDYISIKLAKTFYYAQQAGYKLPRELDMKRLLNYISKHDRYWSSYTKLYSLYVLSLWETNVMLRAADIEQNNKELSVSEYAFLGLIYLNNGDKGRAKKMLKEIKNRMKVGTQTVDIMDRENHYNYYFDSHINSYSLILMLYNELEPESDFVTRIINTIMNSQKNGYWGNTVATEWVIQSFGELFKDEAGADTDYLAKLLVNGEELLSTQFKGVEKSSLQQNYDFEGDKMKEMPRDTMVPLRFEKEGTGELYYTATIRYALPSEVVDARDEGFSIYSAIYDLDGNEIKDIKQMKLGETYRMKTVISTSKNRSFVAVRVPVPSGADILDSSFVTTPGLPEEESESGDEDDYYGYYDYYYGGPTEYIMDNEVQYFFNSFRRGKEEVTFLFRLTTPGIFPTPPATVECMYEEEVFGRTAGQLYVIMPE